MLCYVNLTTLHSKSLLQHSRWSYFLCLIMLWRKSIWYFHSEKQRILKRDWTLWWSHGRQGLKIRENLMMNMATLCIPPSCASAMQLLPHNVRETSNIANVRISVKQTIGRLKGFLLKNELLFPCFPQLIILFVFAVLCVIFFHHSVFNALLTNMPSQVQNTV